MSLPVFPPEVRCGSCKYLFVRGYHREGWAHCKRSTPDYGDLVDAAVEPTAFVDEMGGLLDENRPNIYTVALTVHVTHGCVMWEPKS